MIDVGKYAPRMPQECLEVMETGERSGCKQVRTEGFIGRALFSLGYVAKGILCDVCIFKPWPISIPWINHANFKSPLPSARLYLFKIKIYKNICTLLYKNYSPNPSPNFLDFGGGESMLEYLHGRKEVPGADAGPAIAC